MDRFSVERDHRVFYIRDQGWHGSDCPRNHYPKPALELRFRKLANAQKVCDVLNEEWREFLANPE